jgi:MFS family permease
MPDVSAVLGALARNRALLRVATSWALFVLSEYSVWIAMLVYAYGHGGAGTAGAVAVVQLIPGIVAAPLFAARTDRGSPVVVLIIGYAVQTVGFAATAAVLFLDGPSLLAYAAATLATTAMSATRPAQAALTPSLATSAEQLMALTSTLGWIENGGIMLAGALTGVALDLGQPATVFAGGALATMVGAALLGPLRSMSRPDGEREADDQGAGALAGLGVLRHSRQARLITGLVSAEYVVIGALDLLFVVLAMSVLHRGSQWTGYFNTAYGIGGVAAVAVTVLMLGRRLAGPLFCAGLLIAAALAAAAFSHDAVLTAVLLGGVGLGRAVLDTAAQTLLQRTVRPDVLGRVFGLVELLSGVGLAAGSLFVPALVHLGGARMALVGTAVLIPLVLLVGGRALSTLDAAARVPVVEISLLRSMPHFRALPAPELEGIAHALERRAFADGDIVIRQGEVGDAFYAIAEGRVQVTVDGTDRGRRTRPEGLGEIALIRKVPRTATIVADGPLVLYRLDGAAFLTIVTGHAATADRVDALAATRLAADRRVSDLDQQP